ncbi:MAG: DUF2752 domain-containing protein [Anaerolineae bacterium]
MTSRGSAGVARWLSGATPASRLLLIGGGCLFLALIPLRWLDSGPRICLWHSLFGRCPTCGTTRALAALLRGHPRRALAYNRNVLIVAPLLAAIAARDLWTLLNRWGLAGGRRRPTA